MKPKIRFIKKETHETKKVRAFMDGIDWQYHLEGDANGTRIYGDVASLKKFEPHCVPGGCGIVEVEVRFVRWVKKQTLGLKRSIRKAKKRDSS